MKKFASVLLAVLVAFSMFSFVVSAAGAELVVSADKTKDIKAGDVVTVTVKLNANSGLGVITMDLKYDASAFKVTSMTAGDTSVIVNPNYATGKARATGATAETYEDAITVCTVKFEALKATDSTMSIEIDEAVDKDYNPVAVSSNTVAFKGEVEVPSTEPSTKPVEPSTDPTEPSTDPTEPTDPKDPCEDGHDYSAFTVTKKPTCKEAGEQVKTCKVCGDEIKEAIKATGKCEPGAWKVVKPATTTAEGEKVQECKYCGEVLQRAKIAKLPSDPITNPSIPNTDAQA